MPDRLCLLFKERMTHGRTLFDIPLSTLPGECTDAGDIPRAFGDTDGAPRIEEIERM